MGAAGDDTFFGLVGVTAAGKTALTVALAERWGAEVISVDSMQVYRGMDVGTAKPDAETRRRAPHRVIDCADPDERYDARRYLADAERAAADLRARGVRALHAGGTGFYLRALTHGLFDGPEADLAVRARIEARAEERGAEALHRELREVDPASAERIHPNDVRRSVRALEVLEQTGRTLSSWQQEWRERSGVPAEGRPRRLVGLDVAAARLDERIQTRTRQMLDGGWIEEARAVRDGPGFGPSAIQALGYREVLEHVDGRLTRDELFELVCLRTRQFARRQRTWFRKFPEVCWIEAPTDAGGVERAADACLRHFES